MVLPNDDFENPLDKMPLATNGTNKYHPDPHYDPMIPRPEEQISDWFDESDQIEYEKRYASRHESSPDFEKSAEEIVTMHEKMYREATKNGKHTLGGGSEEQQSRG